MQHDFAISIDTDFTCVVMDNTRALSWEHYQHFHSGCAGSIRNFRAVEKSPIRGHAADRTRAIKRSENRVRIIGVENGSVGFRTVVKMSGKRLNRCGYDDYYYFSKKRFVVFPFVRPLQNDTIYFYRNRPRRAFFFFFFVVFKPERVLRNATVIRTAGKTGKKKTKIKPRGYNNFLRILYSYWVL